MIAIIADDFTGAAELAGISLRYGLKVDLCVDTVESQQSDVLVISSDSRSMNRHQALEVTENILKRILHLKPDWLYKKIDSVLRGYVIDELKIQMSLSKQQRAFIMPANPSLGRTIERGKYYINGIKIDETAFVNDPEFPVCTASVAEIVGNDAVVKRCDEKLPDVGVIIGEAEKSEDYDYWTLQVSDKIAIAGAGDFFTALLKKNYELQQAKVFETQLPHLYVCGTSLKERKEFIKTLDCVCYLPEVIDDVWLQKTSDVVKRYKKVVIAINESNEPALELRSRMAQAVKLLHQRVAVKEIFIEGGSTATAVLRSLNIRRLQPLNELERGVVRMKAGDLFIAVKPGSYRLPEVIKQLYH